jgi:mono/diheme cytochrome c family protein
MNARNRWLRPQPLSALAVFLLGAITLTTRFLPAQTPENSQAQSQKDLETSFQQIVKPFFNQNCMKCHNTDLSTAGIRVDQLDTSLEDRQIPVWEAIRRRVKDGSMPPKGLPQPSAEDRTKVADWIGHAVETARLRPAPKNGLVRRLTVAQYRNTLRELLKLDEDLTASLPPDAVSKDGFVNNKDTLQLSPLLTEAYFDVAEKALDTAIVDPKTKPVIQDFRVDLGAGVNPAPLPEKLVLGAGSALLENSDFMVTQVVPTKPFPFEPFVMRTKYRFIEGYRGNDTVRGWRDFDSIYHAVFADMRGSKGYPKGDPFNPVPQGLLLRPAIPNDEIFGADGTEGPKANFKISLRELPEDGRFRVTVTAAKYNDGLLVDPGARPEATAPGAVVWNDPKTPATVTIPKAGVYQVDIYEPDHKTPQPDATHLTTGLAGNWPSDTTAAGRLEGKAKVIDSPFGKAISLTGGSDGFTVPRAALPTDDSLNVGEGDFSVSAWIHPSASNEETQRRAGIVSLAGNDRLQGWYLEVPDPRGTLRFQMAGQTEEANSVVSSPGGAIKPNVWQLVTAVVRRGRNETRLYVNGALVARASTGTAQFDSPRADLQIGHISRGSAFQGEIADVRLYNRPLEEAEIQALLKPGLALPAKEFGRISPEKKVVLTLDLGDRAFSGTLQQPAFLAVRLDAGPLAVKVKNTGVRDLDRIVFTPLPAANETAKKFLAFEKRAPRVGVHLGLRRDCGSTLAPVGPPQTVASEKLTRYVFEGAIRNFPSPSLGKDNVNYLAGVHEIGIRSEYTDGRDMPRLLIRSVEFEGPYYESWPPPSHKSIFIDSEHKNDPQTYAREIVSRFATRAYRRPVTPAEEASLMAVYQKSAAAGSNFQESVKDALLVVLTSPQFLLLVEKSNSPAPEPLAPYELSSKLSYFLWNAPPDHKTLQLAANGTLRAQLDSEVSRMIADPRFSQFIREFTGQWLNLEKFDVLEPDRKRYPKLTRDTRAQLRQEPAEFLQYLVRNNLPVRDLIESDFVVANETVASYYDLADKPDSGFKFVPIQHKRPELGGLLTEAAIMSGLSDGRESNPVKRGAWLARKIIAEPPADPPPNVPALKEDKAGLTLRQRIEQHRDQPGCRQCHAKIDPWGIAFEQFDAGGRLKAQPVDAKSTLPDKTEIDGANDLKQYLAEDRIDQVAFSFLKHLTTYATGRTLTYSELAWLKQDSLKLKASGYRMQDMFRYVVDSKMFLEK